MLPRTDHFEFSVQRCACGEHLLSEIYGYRNFSRAVAEELLDLVQTAQDGRNRQVAELSGGVAAAAICAGREQQPALRDFSFEAGEIGRVHSSRP